MITFTKWWWQSNWLMPVSFVHYTTSHWFSAVCEASWGKLPTKWKTLKQYLALAVLLMIFFCKYMCIDTCRETEGHDMFLRKAGSRGTMFSLFRIIQVQCLGLSNCKFFRSLSTLVSKWWKNTNKYSTLNFPLQVFKHD